VPHKFAVDNGSTDTEIEQAMDHIRHTIELGRQAELALINIERQGYHNGDITVVVDPNTKTYHGALRNLRLAKYIEPTRDKAPSFADLSVTCGRMMEDSHGGHYFKSCEVTLSGTRVNQIEGKLVNEPFSIIMGNLRLKKTGLSIELKHEQYYNRYDVAQVYKKPTGSSMSSYREIAKCVADHVVSIANSYHDPELQITHDLRMKAREWLVSEGVIQRLSTSLFEQAKIVEVMNA
jgi:hypothetical protein